VTIHSLIKAAKKTAAQADDISKRFADELKQVFRDTERKLRPLLKDAADGDRTAIVKAAQANRVRKELREVLKASGYDDLADIATKTPLDTLATQVLRGRLAQESERFAQGVAIRIEGMKALQLGNLLDEGDAVAKALWQATVRGIFGSRDVNSILTDLGQVLDQREPVIRTLYDTSISIYGRQVEALLSDDSEDPVYAYMGPADEKTRDFCLEHVGKVYTREQIDELDNGQLNDVFLTGGGYNCRHQWMEVSRFSELREIVGTDDRVPEIKDSLDELDEAA
jgi:hypothetical protein